MQAPLHHRLSVVVAPVHENCHIYFGQLTEADHVSPRTLTISDSRTDIQRLPALRLFLQSGQLRFEVNQEQLCDQGNPLGYQVSAKLLQLARRQS